MYDAVCEAMTMSANVWNEIAIFSSLEIQQQQSFAVAMNFVAQYSQSKWPSFVREHAKLYGSQAHDHLVTIYI